MKLALHEEFSLTRDGQPVDLRSKKAQALLVYLALVGKPYSREYLATLFWGDKGDEQARRNLRQALFALRKAVGFDVVVGDENLSVAPDLLQIEHGLKLLPEFYTGAEAFDVWLTEERGAHATRTAAGFVQEADVHLQQHDDESALRCLRSALSVTPLDEQVLRQVMVILERLDRRAEALKEFEAFRMRVRTDLDAEPAVETMALVNALRQPITSSEPETDHPNALVVPFEDLGGGDMATFIGSDVQDELSAHFRSIGIVIVDLSPAAAAEIGGKDAFLAHARKVGAQSLITGSVRQLGASVRLTIRIVAPDQGTSVWTHRTIVHEDDAIERIAEVGSVAAQTLSVYLARYRSSAELVKKLKLEIDRPTAFLATWVNLYWKAFFVEHTRHHLRDLNELCEFAYAKFPKSVEVVISHAIAIFQLAHVSDGKDRMKHYSEAAEILEKAVAIDPSQGWVRLGQIIIYTWFGKFDQVDQIYQTMSEETSLMHTTPGLRLPSLVFQNLNDEAIASVGKVMANEAGSPLLFFRFAYLSLAHFNKGDFAMALRQAESSLDYGREFFMGHLMKIASLECLDRHEDAAHALEDMRLDYSAPTISEFDFLPFTHPDRKVALFDALRQAGMPE